MTQTSDNRPDVLVDTSVAVALVVADHEAHERVLSDLDGLVLGLAGHARFETYSVLTRLPGPSRRVPAEVASIIEHNFPESRYLNAAATRHLADQLAGLGISGGAVYDALVGAAAAHHGLPLATRDERAAGIYRALEVELRLIG